MNMLDRDFASRKLIIGAPRFRKRGATRVQMTVDRIIKQRNRLIRVRAQIV